MINRTTMKEDVILVVCVTKMKTNLQYMNVFKQLLLQRKNIFCFIDAMLMMFFLYLGYQNEQYLKYIKSYTKKILSPSYPLLITT